MMKKSIASMATLALLAFVGAQCMTSSGEGDNANSGGTAGDNEPIMVMATILPLVEFVEKVGGDLVTVEPVIPPGAEPHSYELNPQTLTSISEADLYVKAGHVDFEKGNMERITAQNPEMPVVDGSEGITLRTLEAHSHNGGHGEESHEEDLDPHTWLSVANAIIYVENITKGLIALDPAHQAAYLANRDRYLSELRALDDELHTSLDGVQEKEVIVYHPAFGYFLDDYGFTQLPIEIEGKEPTAAQLQQLIDTANEHRVTLVFVQPQFSDKNAKTVADAINGSVFKVDPLAEHFADNLRSIATILTGNEGSAR